MWKQAAACTWHDVHQEVVRCAKSRTRCGRDRGSLVRQRHGAPGHAYHRHACTQASLHPAGDSLAPSKLEHVADGDQCPCSDASQPVLVVCQVLLHAGPGGAWEGLVEHEQVGDDYCHAY
jgi:hypothetical protein